MERSDYHRGELNESDLPKDPIEGIASWVRDATEAGAPEPTAMCVATASLDGQPSNRFVLMRGIDERGLTFYTNYASRKGEELDDNPRVAASFWWPLLERQIRIEGYAERVSPGESDAYFEGRPIKSRFAAAVSPQSREIPDRAILERAVEELTAEFPDGPRRPEGWGGYRIVPDRIEFWQGRRARLHDRFVYSRTPDGWDIVRLAP